MTNRWLTTRIDSWDGQRELLQQQRYGMIETTAGKLAAVYLRPWPKLLAWPDLWPVAARYHARGKADRCLLYYNQPRRFSNYIALKYVVSTSSTTFATFRAALASLDQIAELKQTDALLCDATNLRISDRLLRRLGWTPHKPQRWHRNYIKRFYGRYPPTTRPTMVADDRSSSAVGAAPNPAC